MTSEPSPPSDLLPMELPLMSSAEASHAKTSASTAQAPALKAHVRDFFMKSSGWFASLSKPESDPNSWFWRTSQRSLSVDLERFLGPWPRSGMISGGIARELPTSEPRNSEIAFGVLPTPRAAKRGNRSPETAIASLKKHGRTKHHRLEEALACLEGETGIPNPEYVEWLMGFPPTWTELPPLETRSSRKSRKSSGERS